MIWNAMTLRWCHQIFAPLCRYHMHGIASIISSAPLVKNAGCMYHRHTHAHTTHNTHARTHTHAHTDTHTHTHTSGPAETLSNMICIYIVCMYNSNDLCTTTIHPYVGDTISNAQWMMFDLHAAAKLSNRSLIMSCFCDRNETVNMEARCNG